MWFVGSIGFDLISLYWLFLLFCFLLISVYPLSLLRLWRSGDCFDVFPYIHPFSLSFCLCCTHCTCLPSSLLLFHPSIRYIVFCPWLYTTSRWSTQLFHSFPFSRVYLEQQVVMTGRGGLSIRLSQIDIIDPQIRMLLVISRIIVEVPGMASRRIWIISRIWGSRPFKLVPSIWTLTVRRFTDKLSMDIGRL